MATTEILLNNSTYTEVLDGEGFVYSAQELEYQFSPLQPTGRGFRIFARNQINGALGQKLWARAISFFGAYAYSNPEA